MFIPATILCRLSAFIMLFCHEMNLSTQQKDHLLNGKIYLQMLLLTRG